MREKEGGKVAKEDREEWRGLDGERIWGKEAENRGEPPPGRERGRFRWDRRGGWCPVLCSLGHIDLAAWTGIDPDCQTRPKVSPDFSQTFPHPDSGGQG